MQIKSQNQDWILDDFIHLAETGARQYAKRNPEIKWKEAFPPAVLSIVGQEWCAEFKREYPKGTYDSLK
jgi:hypothetical protein